MPTNINGNGPNADFTETVEIPANGDNVEIPTYWQPAIQEIVDRLASLKERFGGLEPKVHGHDLRNAFFNDSFDVSAQDGGPWGVVFRPDGTRMFVTGISNTAVYQYDLSTAWDVTTAVFDDSFDVSPQDTGPAGLAFQDDGTRMFVMGGSSDNVYQYDLSTAWDVTTAVFDDSFDVSPQDVAPVGLAFQDDGTRMYVVGRFNDNVYQYDLSTAWDVTTAVFDDSFDVSPQDVGPNDVSFRPDGLRMFVTGAGTNHVYQYDLSTAWDVTTAVFVSSFDLSPQAFVPIGMAFSSDGIKMFVVGGAVVHEYFSNTVVADYA